ncbi:MAG: DUF362 domain-containing protein [Planctomycetales bacterium]|nr:DUF362 domain-containing protein [Planctomycetales bacterium]
MNVAVHQTSHRYECTSIQDAVIAILQDIDADNLISPGDDIVLKPNWVKEHDERHPGPDQWEHIVTHPGLIEAVADYVSDKLTGTGSITICDAPQTDSCFPKLREYCRLDDIVERLTRKYPGTSIKLLDLRPEEWHAMDGVVVDKIQLEGDPAGATHVKLNEASEFVG